jgi:hypothetical protein
MTEVLFYMDELNTSKVADLGTIIDKKDGKVLIQASSGWGASWVPEDEIRLAREVYVYEFWKTPGFILKPFTHFVIFGVFFLLIY